MDLKKISLSPLQSRTVAILGYGNQGRAHALNLRDSGVRVVIGAREGKGKQLATDDGFSVESYESAVAAASVVMFLFPDLVTPDVYKSIQSSLKTRAAGADGLFIGFAHGFAYHFELIEKLPGVGYFLVGPKGAGAILREKFVSGDGLPGVFAVDSNVLDLRELCLAYAKAIGVAQSCLLETTFQEETETDLFGEQTVLCGGLVQLMEAAFTTLVKNGHTPEMAFFETCYEAKLILELWLKYGPAGMFGKISPTAFFGGLTRGKRIITEETKQELEKIFGEVRNGKFAKDWQAEYAAGSPQLKAELARLSSSEVQRAFESLREKI